MLENCIFLFDIDGTLVDMTELHVEAYQQAYREVTGRHIKPESLISRFGMGERPIHEEIFDEYDIEDKTLIDDVIGGWESGVIDSIKNAGNISDYVLPGVVDFLDYLRKYNYAVGVITGNSKDVGEAILKYSNLYDRFDVYTYDEGSENRIEIMKNAVDRLKDKNLLKDDSKIIIIGDSPWDSIAGKSVNAVTVGVASGHYSKEELSDADVVIDSLEEYQRIIDYIERCEK
jgi:phosphoglycolate phosphatase